MYCWQLGFDRLCACSNSKKNVVIHYFYTDHNEPCLPRPPPPPKKENHPGFTVVLIEIQDNGYAECFFFSERAGGAAGVNKVLYGLCENGEYSWTFSPKTRAPIGYFEVTWRLTVKLFPAKSFWAGDMANSVTSQGDSALQPRSGLISFLCPPCRWVEKETLA